MKRFSQLPLTLYRIQVKPQVNLRDWKDQMAKGRTSYDLKTTNGLVMPMEGDVFHTPNGMSLRPNSENMINILRNFRGSPRVYSLPVGTKLPDGLCVIHEHSDHYSLQTTEQIPLPALNDKLTRLLADAAVSVTKEQFLEAQDDEDDQDN